MSSALSESLDVLFNKMEGFVSTKTIVGDAITVDGVTILPLIDISLGVGAGAGTVKSDSGFDGGGLGVKIIPSAIITIHNGSVQLINIKNQDSINKIIDMAPGVISQISSFFSKEDKPKENDVDIIEEKKIIIETEI